jgi:hypothetical protein
LSGRHPADDWRRTGQEEYLTGVRLTWKRFQAYSGNWDHEHCEFCWKKFLDENYAPWMREALSSPSPEHTGFGFTNLRDDHHPAGRHWICRDCFDEFLPEFGWAVEKSDPEAWPYDPPEPDPRPTAADFDGDAESKGP